MMVTPIFPVSAESCDCVIFRFVDVQDFYLTTPRVDVMDTFIDQNEKVSLSILLNSVGSDAAIVNKVAQGQQSGHFELTLHGYNHEDFTSFDFEGQKNLMELSQAKMQSLWGMNSTSFVPPMHQFNDDTLQVMKDLDISIISSGPQGIDPPENIKFIANSPSNITDAFGNYHLPQTSEFYDHGSVPHIKIPHDVIMAAVDTSIVDYGYSVLNLYGTDFAQINSTTGNFDNITNSTEINDLVAIINAIRTSGYTITTFEEITQAVSSPTADLTVIKTIINDNGGSLDITGVDLTLDTASVTNGTVNSVSAGAHTVGEAVIPGYTATIGGDCDAAGSITVTAGQSYTCTITNDDSFCVVPESGNWSIFEDCTLLSNSSAPANVIVQNNSILTIPIGVTLEIDFSQFNLTVEFGSGALIKSGGTIT